VKPYPLLTDVLMWLLVAAIGAYAVYVRRRPHLQAPWRRVTQSAQGMSAFVVLAVFVVIGMLDSLHYRPALEGRPGEAAAYSNEVLSVLDRIVEPLRTHKERTYSAPFAIRAFVREVLEVPGPDGTVRQVREFPRLAFGGAHLKDEADRELDIFLRVLKGLLLALVVWGVVALAVWRTISKGKTLVPWNAVLITAGILLAVAGPVAVLASGYHILGTDKIGRDVFYLALKSIRTGLVIGTLTTLVVLPFAVAMGIMAGYFRGWIDDLIQYVYTTLSSIPGVLLIAAFVLMLQVWIDRHADWALFSTAAQRADARLLMLCVVLGITGWITLARLLRGEALKLRELEYIQAAHAFGVRDALILVRHILPNVMHIVIITLVIDFSGLVLAEAVLSYIGVGVDPSMISFGTMINAARLELSREPAVWWTIAAAFAFMFAMVLSANLFADAVRDAFDPRVRIGGLASA